MAKVGHTAIGPKMAPSRLSRLRAWYTKMVQRITCPTSSVRNVCMFTNMCKHAPPSFSYAGMLGARAMYLA